MDPYAAQTYAAQPAPPSSTTSTAQIQQDPYYYMQPDYDQSQSQSQHYPYYPPQYPSDPYQQQQTQPEQYAQPEQYTQQPEQDAPVHPPGVPVQQPDPNAYYTQQPQQAYYQPEYTDPSYYAYPPPQPQPQQVSYSDPGQGQAQWQQYSGQAQWQQYPGQGQGQGQPAGEYGLSYAYPPNAQAGQHSGFGQHTGPAPHNGSVRGGGRGGGGSRGGGFARGGARSARGGGGGSSFRGRGHGGVVRGGGRVGPRGGGRGSRPIVTQPKPQFLAWCELCRVDCNTQEVLENHMNGKKHKKNVQMQEELKTLAAKSHETQMAATNVMIPDIKVENQTVQIEEQENGLKRKMIDGERKSADEPNKKPKEVVPFICELCDVKCESAPVFDSHLKGRKHVFNFQRFQEQQAALGQVALQALYPALEAALYPVLLQALSQNAMASSSYGYGGLDQQVLQLLQPYLPQSGPAAFPPGPGFGPHGPNPGVTQEKPENEPESKTEEAQVESESKTEEDKVEPESKTDEDKLEPASKTQEDQVEPESKTEEDKVEPESKTDEDKVEPASKTEEDQVEPENKTGEEKVEPESMTQGLKAHSTSREYLLRILNIHQICRLFVIFAYRKVNNMGLSPYQSPSDAGVLCVILVNTAMSISIMKEVVRSILHVIGIHVASWEDLNNQTLTESVEHRGTPSETYMEEFRSRTPSVLYNSLCRRTKQECSVCLVEFKPDAEINRLSCGHVFHTSCVEKWLKYWNVTCPLCRNDMMIPKEAEENTCPM